MSTPDQAKRAGRGPGFALALVAFVLVTVAIIALVFQNQDPVPLRWLWIETEVPLFVVVLVAGLVAVLLDELVGFIWRVRRRRRLTEKAELAKLRSEAAGAAATGGVVEGGDADSFGSVDSDEG